MLVKRPGTSILAIVALALGIGLTTTMFSIVNGAFLRGLPFEESGNILRIAMRTTKDPAGRGDRLRIGDLADVAAQQKSFEQIGGYSGTSADIASPGEPPENLRGELISPTLLRVLRTAPIRGRDFTDADAKPGAPAVALISYRVWESRFRKAEDIVGRSIRLNGKPAEIVGVLPPKFGFPETQDVWMPLSSELPVKRDEGRSVEVIGRLRSGMSVASANTEMAAIAARLQQQYPENKDRTLFAQRFMDQLLGSRVLTVLFTMLAAVFGVLLIACTNVTNLQLARAAERVREIAVRTALGATRGRVVRQLLLEGLLLSAAGALLGIAIAQVGITFFNRAIVDTNPPFWIDIRIDRSVALFVTGITGLAALISSLLPALRVVRQDVNAVLKDEGRGTSSLRIGRLSRLLVMVEMTFSFSLLVVSGLMMKGVIAIGSIDYAFPVDRILVGRLNLGGDRYSDPQRLEQVLEGVKTRVSSAAGVRALALADDVPGRGGGWDYTVEGRPKVEKGGPNARRLAVTPEFFALTGTSPLSGRLIRSSDVKGGELVALVSAALVKRQFPGAEPLGQRLTFEGANNTTKTYTIVGVVPDIAVMTGRPGETADTIYIPLAQTTSRNVFVIARGDGAAELLTVPIRTAIAEVDENLPLARPNSLRAEFDRQTWQYKVFGGLFMTFGFASLLLAAAGLYGVMSFAVRRRTQEIGVRMALGADRHRIVRMIVRQGLIQVTVGTVLGLGLGWLIASNLGAILYNVSATDPLVYGVAIVVLGITGLTASLVPAMRASKVDPLVALRTE